MKRFNGSNRIANVVGNIKQSDASAGFKSEVKHVFESYDNQGVSLSSNINTILEDPRRRNEFVDMLLESFQDSILVNDKAAANAPHYTNYIEKVGQLLDNSMRSVIAIGSSLIEVPVDSLTNVSITDLS
jgi:PPE-repeat protein